MAAPFTEHMSRACQHQIDILPGEWLHTVTGKVAYTKFRFSGHAVNIDIYKDIGLG